MMIHNPLPHQIPDLKQLWKLAFGDTDVFIDAFFENGFAPDRCLCIPDETYGIAAALYWFDCSLEDRKIAYIYGVATHPARQGKGLCRQLMETARSHLSELGFSSILLVPQKEDLRGMYRKLGYRDCTCVSEFFCTDDPYSAPMHIIDAQEYAQLRRQHLPEGSVIQEGDNLRFLASYARFYKGMDFIMAAYTEDDSLFAMEYLGNRGSAAGILCSLGLSQGTFRTPGDKLPFAMFLALQEDAPEPGYFGFAFD